VPLPGLSAQRTLAPTGAKLRAQRCAREHRALVPRDIVDELLLPASLATIHAPGIRVSNWTRKTPL
jgi:hypothetical protein